MVEHLTARVTAWMELEPVVGLLMLVASVALFAAAFRGLPDDASLWRWTRRLLQAVSVVALFVGLLWGLRSVLGDNAATFRQSHGRVSETNYRSLQTIWGAPHVQQELRVTHTRTITEREETWREDPSLPPLFREVEREVHVEQDSLLATRGAAVLTLNERRKGSALYNGFEAELEVAYEVRNNSSHRTHATFEVPLSGQVLYDDLAIVEDDVELDDDLNFTWSGVTWRRTMKPGETHTVVVRYRTRGVEHFYYQIPNPRKIEDFRLSVDVHGMPQSDVNYPEGCLTPTQIEPLDGGGTRLSWDLDGAVTTAGMGVALPKPTQPGARVSLVLSRSPYALMLLMGAVALTLLARRETVSLVDLALLGGACSLQFLTMAGISDLGPGFWGSIGLGASLALGLAFALYRSHPARHPILALVAFFTLLYPLSGLFPDAVDAVDAVVTTALVVYLFGVALGARLSLRGAVAPA